MKMDLNEKSNVPPTAKPNPDQKCFWSNDTSFDFGGTVHLNNEQNPLIAAYSLDLPSDECHDLN